MFKGLNTCALEGASICTLRAMTPMKRLNTSLPVLWCPPLLLMLASSTLLALPCCSGQATSGSLDQVKIVKTPSELLSAIDDDGYRHIVIQAHLDFSETGDLGSPLLQLQLSTKSIQVRGLHCIIASRQSCRCICMLCC